MSTLPMLDFVVINVADVEASFRYYTEVLGFTLEAGQSGPNFRFLQGAPGCVEFGINQADEKHPAGTIELYLKTENAARLHAELHAQDIATSPLMQPPFGTIFALSAPDSEALIMWERNK